MVRKPRCRKAARYEASQRKVTTEKRLLDLSTRTSLVSTRGLIPVWGQKWKPPHKVWGVGTGGWDWSIRLKTLGWMELVHSPSQCASVNWGRRPSAEAICQLPWQKGKHLMCKKRRAGCTHYPWTWYRPPSRESFPPPSETLFLIDNEQAQKRGLSLLNPVDPQVLSSCQFLSCQGLEGGFFRSMEGFPWQ